MMLDRQGNRNQQPLHLHSNNATVPAAVSVHGRDEKLSPPQGHRLPGPNIYKFLTAFCTPGTSV